MIHNVGKYRKFNSITEAYNCVNENDVLWIDEGVYKYDIEINTSKDLFIKGNTYRPGNGEVIISPSNRISFSSIENSTIIIEGLNIMLDEPSFDHIIRFVGCSDSTIIFNKCIFNTMYEEPYIFRSYTNSNLTIRLNYCRLKWKYASGRGADFFAYDAQDINFEINKTILTQPLETIDYNYITFPTVYDYTLDLDRPGYGPYYGTSLIDTPKQFYFKGNVHNEFDLINKVDNVTLDPDNKSDYVNLSSDNLTATVTHNSTTENKYHTVKATVGRNTGRWYWEFRRKDIIYHNISRVGIGTEMADVETPIGNDNRSWAYEMSTGKFYYRGEVTAVWQMAAYNDIIQVALDSFNGRVWFGKNGQWAFEGNPSTGQNPTYDSLRLDIYPMISLYPSYGYDSSVDIIFSEPELSYEIPSGFEFYSTFLSYLIKCINVDTNEVTGITYSDPVTRDYFLTTTNSGCHFLICEDPPEPPNFNNLLIGRLYPKEWY